MAKKVKKESLAYAKKSTWEKWNDAEKKKAFKFAEGYKEFLSENKTEFECVDTIQDILEKNGYKSYEELNKKNIKFPLRVYFNNRGASIAAFQLQKDFIKKGLNLIFSHVDVPRIDLKQNSLRESFNIAFFKTNFYGGIKRYQWANIPLAIHGNIVDKTGKTIKVNIGEDEKDPIFMICDLLPHIRGPQNERKTKDVFKGEELELTAGSMPTDSKDKEIKEKVKYKVLEILNEKYGISEKELFTADLRLVPSINARDMGFDRSMVAAYGHDDRICAYTSLQGLLDAKKSKSSFGVYFMDKEEIGSTCTTGSQSRYVENCLTRVIELSGSKNIYFDKIELMEKSAAVSADVGVAITPTFADVFDVKGDPMMGYGTIVSKFVGGGGKGGSSEATAEFTSKFTRLFDSKKVPWQFGGFGKIDLSGGGTIGRYIAELNIDTIDIGPGVISMHSPYEVISKGDLYSTYLAYLAFLNN